MPIAAPAMPIAAPARNPVRARRPPATARRRPVRSTPLSQARDIRINEGIRVREVRVVSADGEQLGVMPIQQALETARSQELDLVEVAPEAQPPVCRIMDFGKYKYTQARRQKEARKKQTTIMVKEVKMGPKTEKHDFDFKVKHVRRFLEEGHKAKVTVRFKGREMAHTELGWKMLQKMVESVQDLANVENNPRMEGRMLHIMLAPKPAAQGRA
jgi:translation initiation factor IF-3